MPLNEELAERVRVILVGQKDLVEKRMFGGICFMLRGNMLCGVDKSDKLMLRVGKDRYEKLLAHKHAREMDFTGKPLRGFLHIMPAGYKTEKQLSDWIMHALSFVDTLPTKKPKKKATKKRVKEKPKKI